MWHSDSDIHLVTWLCHFCVTWFHLSHDIGWFIYFRIVFRIGKRIWVKMKFFNVCCLMLTMLNNGWQKENWLLRDQSRLEDNPFEHVTKICFWTWTTEFWRTNIKNTLLTLFIIKGRVFTTFCTGKIYFLTTNYGA